MVYKPHIIMLKPCAEIVFSIVSVSLDLLQNTIYFHSLIKQDIHIQMIYHERTKMLWFFTSLIKTILFKVRKFNALIWSVSSTLKCGIMKYGLLSAQNVDTDVVKRRTVMVKLVFLITNPSLTLKADLNLFLYYVRFSI